MPHDPNIPRRRGSSTDPRGTSNRSNRTTTGWFTIARDGTTVLESKAGHQWPLKWVSILQGSFGDMANQEGMSKLPRRRTYDSSGNVIEPGDRVVIDFLDGDWRTPLVRGGVRGAVEDDLLTYNHDSDSADEDRLAVRLRPRTDGDVKGEVTLTACEDGERKVVLKVGDTASDSATITIEKNEVLIEISNGNKVRITEGNIELAQSLAAGGKFIRIGSDIEMGQALPIHPYILSLTYLADIAAFHAAIQAYFAAVVAKAPTGPTGPENVALATTVVAAMTAAPVAAKTAASLGAGAPYLSRNIKGD